jgi:hypothetical protein
MNDRPLLERLNPASVAALIRWGLAYAIAHPDAVTAADVAKAWRGDLADRRAAALFTLYGVGRG